MKRSYIPLLGVLAFLAFAGPASAFDIHEVPISDIKPSTSVLCVPISTSAWTQFPPSGYGNLRNRDGIWIAGPASLSANLVFAITASSTTNAPGILPLAPATTNQIDGTVTKGVGPTTIRVPDWMRLWLLSLHTAAETWCGREYIQK
jgi:hypothetical protein